MGSGGQGRIGLEDGQSLWAPGVLFLLLSRDLRGLSGLVPEDMGLGCDALCRPIPLPCLVGRLVANFLSGNCLAIVWLDCQRFHGSSAGCFGGGAIRLGWLR